GRGTVTLDLEVPRSEMLDPLAADELARLASFRLRRDNDSTALAEARFIAGRALAAGSLPAGPALDLDLDALADNGEILALGRLRNVAVPADADLHLTVHLRKPIGYVVGGPTVLLRDATKAAASVTDPGELPAAAAATSVAATHDGTAVLFAVGASVLAVSTMNHALSSIQLALPEPAT